ncbi:two-component regulator propeller domain-containing protein [Hymenobacter sp.]|uniref:two-component regulator propeller domain-containing protein n=1 Tax=Hymenobacter sp. TaxID=1898978 RepID=UPI00286A140E|nr:two-component regulator propeller domain-containing protein [Hymenobacter sp.]
MTRFPRLSLRAFLFGLWLSLLLSTGPGLLAKPRPRYAVAGNEKPVALLQAGKATYLVTERSVFRLEGPQFVRKYQGSGIIQCATVADTVLWLGTKQGVLRMNTREFRPRPLVLPVPEPNVTAVFQDRQGALWVGALGYGVFHLVNGEFVHELRTPTINAGVATADSSVWIGTNIGLNRKQGPNWTRYNEEGVANQEIPDNYVEKLLPDNVGNLWVIMSDGICVFEARGQRSAAEAELPTVKFLGRPGNEVHGVAYVAGEGRVFATAMGLLLLPNEPANRLDSFAPSADKVEQKQLLVPLPALPGTAAKTPPVLIQVDPQQRLWLVSAGEVAVLTAKEFHKFVHAKGAGSGVAGNLTP